MLEEKKVHLPSILQSLGCIAQISMPIFETREEEIINFITKKILESNDVRPFLFELSFLIYLLYCCHHNSKCQQDMVENSSHKSEWGDCTQNCLLKVSEVMVLKGRLTVQSKLPDFFFADLWHQNFGEELSTLQRCSCTPWNRKVI